jgi:asparagine synthase (glutamine-hydrolysing)
MSGIGGVVRPNGQPLEPAELDHLRLRLAGYGPVAAHTWQGGQAGLVHCLLRITLELAGEQQPLAAGKLVIAADARLTIGLSCARPWP